MAQSSLKWVRCTVRVIRMVSELHRMGFQRLRLMPYESPTGYNVWIAAAPAFSMVNPIYCEDMEAPHACYHASSHDHYFDWDCAAGWDARQLADNFVKTFDRLCQLGRGSDWVYAGWLADLLARLEAHPDKLPHVDLTDFVDVLPTEKLALPLRRVPGAGPEITPGDILFPLPPVAA